MRSGNPQLSSPSNQAPAGDSPCAADEGPSSAYTREGEHSEDVLPGYTMRSEREEEGSRGTMSGSGGGRSGGVSSSENMSEDFRRRPPAAVRGDTTITTPPAAGKKNSFSINMLELLNHSPGEEDGRAKYAPRRRHDNGAAATAVAATLSRAAAPTKTIRHRAANGIEVHASTSSPNATPERLHEEAAAGEGAGSNGSAADSALGECLAEGRSGGVGGEQQQHEASDEAYMHSLGYGNLSSVLPILLDRRGALEVSLLYPLLRGRVLYRGGGIFPRRC